MAKKAKQADETAAKTGDGAKSPDDLHKRAIERYKALEDYWSENRNLALEDIKFRAGDQWPAAIKKKREDKSRPVLTFHKQEAYIRQVVNDGRQNRPSVKFRPVDDGADVEVANAYQGITRSILAASNADEAFDTALDHACGNGFGYFRVITDYVHDGGFEQDIRVKRIRNPLSVLLAPHQAADASDAEDGFVVDEMSREEFTRTYPQAKKVDWKHDEKHYASDWLDSLTVRVAEYFYKSAKDETLLLLADGQTVTRTEYDKAVAEGVAGMPPIKRERLVRDITVKWCRLSGAEVLEEGEFPSRYIPIIPVYGSEMDIEGKVVYSGLIRPALDSLRLYNFERTAYCERVALSPKSPFIAAEGQTEAHPEWETANTENHAVLTYTPTDVNGQLAPPPQRQPATDIPAAYSQASQITEHDIQSAMGIYKAGLGDQSNEKSGRAILARQKEGDVSTFHFHDNLNRAVRHLGRILLELIPRIYDTKRMVRMLGEDGSDEEALVDPDLGAPSAVIGKVKAFNLRAGRYDVDVSAGPSYTTKRQESAEAMLAMAERDPAIWRTHGDLIVKSQDWPMAEEFAERTKAIMPPEIKAAIAQGEGEEGEGESAAIKQIIGQAEQAIAEREKALEAAGKEIERLKREAGDAKRKADAEKAKADAEIYKAETERLKIVFPFLDPAMQSAIQSQTVAQASTPGDLDGGSAPDDFLPTEPMVPAEMGGMPAPMQ